MTSAEHEFNLIDQPWLPARTETGEAVELSIMEVFRQAPRLATLQGELPTQTFALVRLLLAVLHRAVDGPADKNAWAELWDADELPTERIAKYLQQHHSRFDLFHPRTPFFQVAELRTGKGFTGGIGGLIADVPNGAPFFTTRLGGEVALSFAEAARWLVHCHAFDTSGIKTGAVDDPEVKGGRGYARGTGWGGRLGGVLLEGANVRETLLLNLISRNFGSTARAAGTDLPAWELRPHGPAQEMLGGRPPTGPLDMFTWQARRIRLFPDGDRVTRVLVCYGDSVEQHNRYTVEPQSLWRRSKPQEKKLGESPVYMPRRHEVQRSIWRGLQSMLPGPARPANSEPASGLTAEVLEWVAFLTEGPLSRELPVRVRAIGMDYGTMDSVVDEVSDDAMSIKAHLLSTEAQHLAGVAVGCVDAADAAAWALGRLALNLAQAEGKLPPASGGLPDPQAVSDRTRAVERAFGDLDPAFRIWLARLGPDTDPEQAQEDWHNQARAIIRGLAAELQGQAAPSAWVGRLVHGRLITAAHAQVWFDRELRKAVPLAYPATSTEQAS